MPVMFVSHRQFYVGAAGPVAFGAFAVAGHKAGIAEIQNGQLDRHIGLAVPAYGEVIVRHHQCVFGGAPRAERMQVAILREEYSNDAI